MSNTRSCEPREMAQPAVGPAEGSPVGADELAELVRQVRAAEAHLASAVLLAGRVAASGVAERVEGLPLELHLGLAGRMTGADRRMLVAAGEVLADLPTVSGLFAAGRVSWGQVRAIVAGARRLSKADRAALDERVAASVKAYAGVDAWDPDGLVEAVDAAVEDLRGSRAKERTDTRSAEDGFVAVQAGLDGGLQMYAQLGPVSGAIVLNALDNAAGRPAGADHDGDPGEGEQQVPGVWATARGGQYAQAMRRIAANWLAGDGKNRAAKPLFIAHVQLGTASTTGTGPAGDTGDGTGTGPAGDTGDGTGTGPAEDAGNGGRGADTVGNDPASSSAGDPAAGCESAETQASSGEPNRARFGEAGADLARAENGTAPTPDGDMFPAVWPPAPAAVGTIVLNVRGNLTRLGARVLEQLATDADLRTVLFDGTRPLAVSAKTAADDIPARTRMAIAARDQGCRFPGSRDPIGHCDVHHITERASDGDHHPENLVALSRRHHTLVHRRGWTLTLNPATGELTITRGQRRWRSLPRGTPLAHPPPPTGPPQGTGPPARPGPRGARPRARPPDHATTAPGTEPLPF